MKPIDQARNALSFLEDETHEHAFDKLIWGLRERRDAAAREVPEWEQLRTLASQIKEHTLSHLGHYLELFEARATRNGVQVHWARDAHEHNQIVYDILNSHGARHLVKSKSMLTEECDTRPFLERRGIEVTETDLGERIQQLDDQPPSHIVGPAFQKTTQDVAELFHRVYGSDQDRADPVYLAHVMREHTRPLILQADAGMTGANFAVAQTGAVVTVTNEGNADLSGNVPKLRICSVGIEKIIPGVEQLAVFIRLLTRSATGERITQYTSHFAGPRADGEMHIVLVDNGRTQRLADERFCPSLKCIRCAACMNTCPVYRRSGGLIWLHLHGAHRHHHDADLRDPPPQRAAVLLDDQRQLHERLPRRHQHPRADLSVAGGDERQGRVLRHQEGGHEGRRQGAQPPCGLPGRHRGRSSGAEGPAALRDLQPAQRVGTPPGLAEPGDGDLSPVVRPQPRQHPSPGCTGPGNEDRDRGG
jgi:iron-sulfur cluster protein